MEISELQTKNFSLKAKLSDVLNLAEKYKEELESFQSRHREVDELIHSAKHSSILKASEHDSFIQSANENVELIDEARENQRKMVYSALDSDIS